MLAVLGEVATMDGLHYCSFRSPLEQKNAGWVNRSPNPLITSVVLRGARQAGANPKAHALNMSVILPQVNHSAHASFPATAAEIIALRETISPARLTTYVRHAHGNLRRAFELYAWNVEAAAALYPILQVNEIALRNAINRALVSQFGAQWPYSPGFLRTLPKADRVSFESGRTKLERNLRLTQASTGDVVASQTYWFWVLLLTSRFDQRIWTREFTSSFPCAPPNVDRRIVHDRADEIRRLRNRIAHHEPLLDHNLVGAYQRAASMVRWISPVKATWAAIRWSLDHARLKRP